MSQKDQQLGSENVSRGFKIDTNSGVFFGLLFIAFFAHFVLLSQFAIYEDDYILTLPLMKWSAVDLPGHLWDALIHSSFGRPINYLIRGLIFFLTVRNGNVEIGYIFSLLMVSLNAYLFFMLLRREVGFPAAFSAAIFYLLYPVDTSRQILMHQTDMHLGATILLSSFLLYQHGRVILAFCVSAVSLLVCEWWYLPFLAAPLIFPSKNRRSVRGMPLHVVIFFAVAGFVFFARRFLGEQRAAQVLGDVSQLPGRILGACTLGPLISAQAALSRPIDAILHAEPYGYFLGFVCAAFLVLVMWRYSVRDTDKSQADANYSRGGLLLMLLGGILAWSFSYFLSFLDDYYPPVVTIGRLSAVHTVGTFGAAICFAVCFKFVYRGLSARFFWPLIVAVSIYFGSLVAFGVHIQASEYVANGKKQKEVWTAIIRQISDIQDGDVVLFEESADRNVMPVTQGFAPFGEVNYFPMALPYFVSFPKTWKKLPRVFGLWPGCEFEDLPGGRRLHTPVWAPSLWPVIRDGEFIYFRVERNQLTRVEEPVNILGRMFQPKVYASSGKEKPLRLSKLFRNIFDEPDSGKWFTIRDARNYPE